MKIVAVIIETAAINPIFLTFSKNGLTSLQPR